LLRIIEVTYETVRQWALRFDQQAGIFDDKRHLDEVVITINGKYHPKSGS
jgi:transposase-like protein